VILRLVVLAALSGAVTCGSIACSAAGGGDAIDSGESSDTEPHLLDTAEDDTATPDDAPSPDDVGTDDSGVTHADAKSDSPPPSDSGSIVDTGTVIDTGCTPSCTTCGADDGCGGTCSTGSCGGGATCVGGTCVSPTKSFVSPMSYPSAWGAFARGIDWTIASEDPSTIHYTTDGSAPTSTSAGGASPVTLSVSTSGTDLNWISDDGATEPMQTFHLVIDSTLQSKYGYVVDDLTLDGTSPVVVVSPGASLAGGAKYQAWVSTGCPLCRQQIVYGIESTPAGCLYDYSPSTWPGVSGTGSIALTAPSTPGTYKVRVAFALQLSCTDALTTANPLGVEPTTEVGIIVVK
jgi:hypothetical protein